MEAHKLVKRAIVGDYPEKVVYTPTR
ncbi:hypothetical protein [Spirosoma validum]|nr:hypothetical protein [Spirosoma validum]